MNTELKLSCIHISSLFANVSAFLFIWGFVCIYLYAHVCMCVYVCVYVYMMGACEYVCVCACMYACVYKTGLMKVATIILNIIEKSVTQCSGI